MYSLQWAIGYICQHHGSRCNHTSATLYWILHRDARNALVDDGFGLYDDVKVLTEKEVSTMATNFSGRTGANGRMYFGKSGSKI